MYDMANYAAAVAAATAASPARPSLLSQELAVAGMFSPLANLRTTKTVVSPSPPMLTGVAGTPGVPYPGYAGTTPLGRAAAHLHRVPLSPAAVRDGLSALPTPPPPHAPAQPHHAPPHPTAGVTPAVAASPHTSVVPASAQQPLPPPALGAGRALPQQHTVPGHPSPAPMPAPPAAPPAAPAPWHQDPAAWSSPAVRQGAAGVQPDVLDAAPTPVSTAKDAVPQPHVTPVHVGGQGDPEYTQAATVLRAEAPAMRMLRGERFVEDVGVGAAPQAPAPAPAQTPQGHAHQSRGVDDAPAAAASPAALSGPVVAAAQPAAVSVEQPVPGAEHHVPHLAAPPQHQQHIHIHLPAGGGVQGVSPAAGVAPAVAPMPHVDTATDDLLRLRRIESELAHVDAIRSAMLSEVQTLTQQQQQQQQAALFYGGTAPAPAPPLAVPHADALREAALAAEITAATAAATAAAAPPPAIPYVPPPAPVVPVLPVDVAAAAVAGTWAGDYGKVSPAPPLMNMPVVPAIPQPTGRGLLLNRPVSILNVDAERKWRARAMEQAGSGGSGGINTAVSSTPTPHSASAFSPTPVTAAAQGTSVGGLGVAVSATPTQSSSFPSDRSDLPFSVVEGKEATVAGGVPTRGVLKSAAPLPPPSDAASSPRVSPRSASRVAFHEDDAPAAEAGAGVGHATRGATFPGGDPPASKGSGVTGVTEPLVLPYASPSQVMPRSAATGARGSISGGNGLGLHSTHSTAPSIPHTPNSTLGASGPPPHRSSFRSAPASEHPAPADSDVRAASATPSSIVHRSVSQLSGVQRGAADAPSAHSSHPTAIVQRSSVTAPRSSQG